MSIRITNKANPSWGRFIDNRTVTTTRTPLVSRADRFFLMGSCFAEEIRLALEASLGSDRVGPDYSKLIFDPKRVQVDELPARNHMNFYNSFSVLQEIQRILGLWTQAPDDLWQVDGRVQDPYRRLIFADTQAELNRINTDLDAILREAFQAADHFVFTFGMTEVFLNKRSGKVACQKPGYGRGGGKDETEYHNAGFAENKAVLDQLVALIVAAKPKARIFMTVSPVALKRTHSGQDIFVANMRSKSTLRTVLAEVDAEHPAVTYFPSFDAVMASGAEAFEADGRHVKRDVVAQITRTFVQSYFCD